MNSQEDRGPQEAPWDKIARGLRRIWATFIVGFVASLCAWGAFQTWPEGLLDTPFASYTLMMLLKLAATAALAVLAAVFAVAAYTLASEPLTAE